jgi:hypothetical protein
MCKNCNSVLECGLILLPNILGNFMVKFQLPIPVAARFKAWVCGHSLAGIAVPNPAGGMVVCCQVQISATADH